MNLYVYFLENNGSHVGLATNGNLHLFIREADSPSSMIRAQFSITLERDDLPWSSIEAAVRQCYGSLSRVEDGREYFVPVTSGFCNFVSRDTAFVDADHAIQNLKIAVKNIAHKYNLDTLFR